MPDGVLVLLSERTGKLYCCNATAAAMWVALDEHDGQLDAVVTTVAEQHQANPARVRADLDQLVEEWEKAGLVRSES
jgi:hypothetical protein